MFDDILFKFLNLFFIMPELPEVETVRLALTQKIIKRKISKTIINTKKIRFKIPNKFKERTKGKTVLNILRRGKYLIIFLDSHECILVHLGMTGVFRISKDYLFKKHDHIIFYFEDFLLIYNDMRKFGFVKLFHSSNVFDSSHLKKIGPEPFEISDNSIIFKNKIFNSNQTTKAFLMNQKNIAGLGNIYCSEILFNSKISPLIKIKDLDIKKINILIKSIKIILKSAIREGGTSLKDFKNLDGNIGYFKNQLKVYGRENKNCFNCKNNNKIIKIIQNGRSTFFCKNCQK
ncbi:MAG: DNA-formamidopyrimidine glycosylase [Rickettsiales bacterium]|nr:DNA-formamidopyrimidine glycosylase [Rickettsiales bacterium]